jgi:hypothetical protein
MALAHKSTGAFTFLQNSFSPTLPTHAAGDMLLLLCGGKPYNRQISPNPAGQGWTSLGSFTDGTVAVSGADTGSMNVEAWYKEATSGSEVAQLAEGSPAWDVVGGGVMCFSKSVSEIWNTPVATGGGDASAGTAFFIASLPDLGITTGDHVISLAAFRSDAATPCSSHLVAVTTGVTYTNTHDPATDPETTTGFDMGMCVNRATVSGTSSAGSTIQATLAAAHTGSAMMIRLRVYTPAPHIYIPVGFAQGRDY